jgi:MarR family transcriptional regulator, organic hydroperoxide resistance regulator
VGRGLDRLEDCISFLVGKAAQHVARRTREKLAPYDVTPTRYAVLKVLWQRDGQSGAEIGARLLIDSATITGVIDRLEAAQLLERRPAPEDRRVHRLFLTPQGRSLRQPLDQAMASLNAEAKEILGADTSTVWHALRRLGDPHAW